MAKKCKASPPTNVSAIAGPIDQLSRALVLAEPDDPRALAMIHTTFCEIAQWCADNGQARLAAALRQTSDLIESIILNDVANPAASMETVNRVATITQSIILLGQDAASVTFPAELKLVEPAAEEPPAKAPAKAPAKDTPPNADPTLLADFLARQHIVLEEFEQHILTLEKQPNAASLAGLLRLLHTLKGEAGLLGLTNVARVCHATEDALDHKSPALLIDLLLAVKDWLGQTLAATGGKSPASHPAEALLKMLEGHAGSAAPAAKETKDEKAGTAPAPASPAVAIEDDANLLSDFINEAREHLEGADVCLLNLEADSQDSENINALFRRFHTIKGVAGFLGLEEIRALAHESESLLDRARKGEIMLVGGVIDAIFDSVDALKRLVGGVQQSLATGTPIVHDEGLPKLLNRLQSAAQGNAGEGVLALDPERAGGRKLGEILVEAGTASRETVDRALDRQQASPEGPRLGELLVREGQASARDVAQALRAQRVSNTNQTVQVKETVKVDADRLDQLVEMIGELVIAESMVSQSPEVREVASAQLQRFLNQLDKITRELQEMGTSLRMVPLRSTFQKMARLVRDLGKKSGKQVEFVMAGEDTELDKTVVDKIGDPLVHMVRNAVDHGLESNPEDREAAGKPAVGQVELRAFHRGGNIFIEIQDDGKGLDRKAIAAKGIERGLVREGDTLTDRDIFNLIFQPGFSTAQVVSDVSGRGVGMDVVKRNIDALRGQIDITSETGRGTTFSIKLPLTLAIIDGMVIRVGDERYIIPTLSIIRSIRPKPGDLTSVLGRGEVLSVQGQLIPIFRLGTLFGIAEAGQDPLHSIIVIVEDEGRQIGLMTDELLGQQQIVIKSLGEGMRGIPGISGGAIMPDGQVGLILDVSGLVRLARVPEGLECGAGAGEEALLGQAATV